MMTMRSVPSCDTGSACEGSMMMQEGRSLPILAGTPSPPAAMHPHHCLPSPCTNGYNNTPEELPGFGYQSSNQQQQQACRLFDGETSQLYYRSHRCNSFMDHYFLHRIKQR